MPRTDIDRFKFNLLIAFGLFWITLTGGCSVWFLLAAAVDWLNNGPGRGLAGVTFALGSIALIPGMIAWHWGKIGAGYDPSRDLRNAAWKLPQAVGILFAIGSLVTGTIGFLDMMSGWFEGSCAKAPSGCDRLLSNSLILAAFHGVPGVLLLWASTRP